MTRFSAGTHAVRVLSSAVAALCAGTCISASASAPPSDVPDWKLKLVWAYPVKSDRAGMLLSVFKEHCDLSAIAGVDAEDLLRAQILPGMLGGKATYDSVRENVSRTMKSLHCTPPGAAIVSTTAPAQAAAVTSAPAQTAAVTQGTGLQTSTATLSDTAARSSVPAEQATTATANSKASAPANQDDPTRLNAAQTTATRALQEVKQGGTAVENLAYCRKYEGNNNAQCKFDSLDSPDPKNPKAASCDELPAQAPCQGTVASLSDQQHKRNLQSYKTLKTANDIAQTLDKGSKQAAITQSSLDAAGPFIGRSANIDLSRVAQYGIYAGPNYSLGGDGSWKAGGEFLARFDDEAVAPSDGPGAVWICPPLFLWCRGYTEFSYQSIAALDKSKSTTDTPPFDPFAQSGGYFRFNTGWRLHMTDWFGFEVGAGLSSLPGSSGGELTRLKPRVTAGLQLQTLFSDGSLGQLFAGTAHDKFWTRTVLNDASDPTLGSRLEKNRSRWIVDGIVMIPGLELDGWKMAARLTADTPTDGRGPSDVRASFLLYYPLNNWIQSNLPSKASSDTSK